VSVEDNFASTQRLSIKVDSHSSTILLDLDTLPKHRMLIFQLQDEVDFFRGQGESMQRQLDSRTSPSEASVTEQTLGKHDSQEVKERRVLPDLNVVVETLVEVEIKE